MNSRRTLTYFHSELVAKRALCAFFASLTLANDNSFVVVPENVDLLGDGAILLVCDNDLEAPSDVEGRIAELVQQAPELVFELFVELAQLSVPERCLVFANKLPALRLRVVVLVRTKCPLQVRLPPLL